MTLVHDDTPATHPYSAHLQRVAAAGPHRAWTPDEGALPSLYISHGAPPLLEDMEWMDQLFGWARALPRPTAVLIVSAHWESAPLSITSPEAGTPLVYDFGGFPQLYYRMQYPTPAAHALAGLVRSVMPDGQSLHEDSRGLDHGAWVPLKTMYPEADVPVLQLSLPTSDPDRLLALGARLRGLREEGVLVVGSGFTTHGLPFLSRSDFLGHTLPGWSMEFDAWAAEQLARGDVDALADYRHRAPGMPYAHPTVEHFVPLFVTLGAATDPEAPRESTIDGFWMGLSKRSLQVA
jgi:4,5-DOPA dioxygenase extradiol